MRGIEREEERHQTIGEYCELVPKKNSAVSSEGRKGQNALSGYSSGRV